MSNSINFHEDEIEKYECKPSKCQQFIRLFYDPHEKKFIGRTKGSWCKIGFFFLIYYISLSAFFVSMLAVFLKGVVRDDMPVRTGGDSFLRLQPGISLRPLTDYGSTLIRVIPSEPESYMNYVMDLKSLYAQYEEIGEEAIKSGIAANCDNGVKVPDDPKIPCRFNLSQLGPCSNFADKFGYSSGSPCVILKLNKIYGWIPDPIDGNTSALVKCEGQNYIDKTNIGTPVYYPSRKYANETMGYFDHNFYPFLGQVGYLPPLVAVQFPEASKRIAILIKCSVKNVKYESNIMRFELIIDSFDKNKSQ